MDNRESATEEEIRQEGSVGSGSGASESGVPPPVGPSEGSLGQGSSAREAGVSSSGRRCCWCLDVLVSSGVPRRRGSKRDGERPIAPERVIDNILEIEGDKKLSAAFKEWVRQEKYCKSKLDDGEKEISGIVTQIYTIVGFLSVFQGVVFTAVSQLATSDSAQCGKFWVPGSLTVIAALVSIGALLEKYMRIRDSESKIISARAYFRVYTRLVKVLPSKGRAFSFEHDVKNETPAREDLKFWSFWFKKILFLLVLIIFTAGFVLSYLVILCDKWLIPGWS